MHDIETIERALRSLLRGPHLTRLHKHLNEAAGVDLDRPAYVALSALAEVGPLTVTALAEAISVDPSTGSRLAERLRAAGLLHAQRAPHDQRVSLLDLTDQARVLIARLHTVRRQTLEELLAAWPADEQAIFAELLHRFVTDLDELAVRAPRAPVHTVTRPAERP